MSVVCNMLKNISLVHYPAPTPISPITRDILELYHDFINTIGIQFGNTTSFNSNNTSVIPNNTTINLFWLSAIHLAFQSKNSYLINLIESSVIPYPNIRYTVNPTYNNIRHYTRVSNHSYIMLPETLEQFISITDFKKYIPRLEKYFKDIPHQGEFSIEIRDLLTDIVCDTSYNRVAVNLLVQPNKLVLTDILTHFKGEPFFQHCMCYFNYMHGTRHTFEEEHKRIFHVRYTMVMKPDDLCDETIRNVTNIKFHVDNATIHEYESLRNLKQFGIVSLCSDNESYSNVSSVRIKSTNACDTIGLLKLKNLLPNVIYYEVLDPFSDVCNNAIKRISSEYNR